MHGGTVVMLTACAARFAHFARPRVDRVASMKRNKRGIETERS